jgi:hypothetical protein
MRYLCLDCDFQDEDPQVVRNHQRSHTPPASRFRIVNERTGALFAETLEEQAALGRATEALRDEPGGSFRLETYDPVTGGWKPVLSFGGYSSKRPLEGDEHR